MAASAPLSSGKPRSDQGDPWAEKAVGAAHHRVLLVQDARNPQQGGGDQRRHRRIAAEADDGPWLDASELDQRRGDAEAERRCRLRLAEKASARRRRGRKSMDGAGGKIPTVFQRAVIRRKLDLHASPRQGGGEGGRRKEMPAGPACRQKDAGVALIPPGPEDAANQRSGVGESPRAETPCQGRAPAGRNRHRR